MARVATECLSTEGVPQTASIVMEAVCMQTYLLSPRQGVLKFVGREWEKMGCTSKVTLLQPNLCFSE